MASSFVEVRFDDGNSLSTEAGHQAWTSLFSLVNKNLLPAAPQKTAVGSPKREVLKTLEEYLVIRSNMNFSGWPFHPEERNSRLSPMTGHPVLPGGALSEEEDLFL